MTIAETVCELLYAGKTLAEVAGYDDAFMRYVLCRPRDEYGRLLRHSRDLPWWVTTDADGQWVIRNSEPYAIAFDRVLEVQGFDESQRRCAWAQWRLENPSYDLAER